MARLPSDGILACTCTVCEGEFWCESDIGAMMCPFCAARKALRKRWCRLEVAVAPEPSVMKRSPFEEVTDPDLPRAPFAWQDAEGA